MAQTTINEQTLVNEQRLLAYDCFQNTNKVGLLSALEYLDFVNHLVKSNQIKYLLVPSASQTVYQHVFFDHFRFLSFENNLLSGFGLAIRLHKEAETVFMLVEKTKQTETEIKKLLEAVKQFSGLKLVVLLVNSPFENKRTKLSYEIVKIIKKHGYQYKRYCRKNFEKKFFNTWNHQKRKQKTKNNLFFVELNSQFAFGTSMANSNSFDLSFTSFKERFNTENNLDIDVHFNVPHKYLLKNLESIKHHLQIDNNTIWKQAFINFAGQLLLYFENLQVFAQEASTLQVNAIVIKQDAYFIVEVMKGYNYDNNCICLLEANKDQNVGLTTVSTNTLIGDIKQYEPCFFIEK